MEAVDDTTKVKEEPADYEFEEDAADSHPNGKAGTGRCDIVRIISYIFNKMVH